MTPSQQAALQAVYTAHGGGTFSAQQVTDLTPLVTARNDAAVAAYLNPSLPPVLMPGQWITDRGLVDAAVRSTGTNALSDSILSKLDAAMANSRSAKAVVGRLYTDPTGIDFGNAALAAWFDAELAASAFTQPEHDFLVGLGKVVKPSTTNEISDALNGA